ncbi:MAG TPA: hypothetical protein VGW58_03185 [Pyrinomonadaceae bacterium]|nr:hypothetical protein [Pyrinomonadaceae bacterium]
MPKDSTKNVDRYKVRGGHLNEYDFEKEKAADKTQIATDKKTAARVSSKQAATPKTAKKKS